MQLPQINKLNFRSIIIVIILLGIFIVHSCKKDNSTNQDAAANNTVIVNLAKQWYGATYPINRSNATRALQSIPAGTSAWSKTFIPDWSNANTYIIDSLTYIELPAIKRGDMAMSYQNVSPGSFNFGKSQSLTSLIIVNKHGNFYMYAMTLLADSSYLNGDYSKLQKNTYRSKDKKFSGKVFYHRMDGSFVNGWSFQNGVVNGIITLAATGNPTVAAAQSNKSNNGPVADVAYLTDCETTITTIYWEQCSYYKDDADDQFPMDCFVYTTQSSFSVCTTTPVGTNNGGGSSNPNPPCTVSSGGGSSSDSLVENAKFGSREADPNPPGGSAPPGGIVDNTNQIGTDPCPPPNPNSDTTKMTFCNGLTSAEKISIINTINAFKSEDCASKFLYNYFSNQSFTYCISPGNYNVIFNPANNSFTFSTDEVATPTFADLLEHEYFHAFQNATYPGGIESYGQNASTGVNSPGFVNIEFEQAIFNDIVTGNYNAFNSGTLTQQKAYATFISGLTSGGTAYPKLIPGTSAYTTFISEYNSFLNQYNALPDNPNTSPIINLTPQAFINLFNNVNPNC